jgi:inner membrane transporter RhtA
VAFRHAVVFAVGAQFCVNLGSGLAVNAFAVVGPAGIVLLRNGIPAALLLIWARPRLRGLTRRAWAALVAYGLMLAAMNSVFYEALEVMPMGEAVTIEMLGPLTLAVALVRRWRAWLWAALALGGVCLLSGFDPATLGARGTLLALAAGAFWATYIVATRQVGREFGGGRGMARGLALGMAVSTVACLPRGVAALAAAPFTWEVVGWGTAVAVSASLIPYAMEMAALRGMSAATFGVMTALAPGSAALIGWLVAGQTLTWWAVGGMALVTVASAGAAWGDPNRRPATP